MSQENNIKEVFTDVKTLRKSLDYYQYQFHNPNIKSEISEAELENLKQQLQILAPYDWRYKFDIENSITGDGIKKVPIAKTNSAILMGKPAHTIASIQSYINTAIERTNDNNFLIAPVYEGIYAYIDRGVLCLKNMNLSTAGYDSIAQERHFLIQGNNTLDVNNNMFIEPKTGELKCCHGQIILNEDYIIDESYKEKWDSFLTVEEKIWFYFTETDDLLIPLRSSICPFKFIEKDKITKTIACNSMDSLLETYAEFKHSDNLVIGFQCDHSSRKYYGITGRTDITWHEDGHQELHINILDLKNIAINRQITTVGIIKPITIKGITYSQIRFPNFSHAFKNRVIGSTIIGRVNRSNQLTYVRNYETSKRSKHTPTPKHCPACNTEIFIDLQGNAWCDNIFCQGSHLEKMRHAISCLFGMTATPAFVIALDRALHLEGIHTFLNCNSFENLQYENGKTIFTEEVGRALNISLEKIKFSQPSYKVLAACLSNNNFPVMDLIKKYNLTISKDSLHSLKVEDISDANCEDSIQNAEILLHELTNNHDMIDSIFDLVENISEDWRTARSVDPRHPRALLSRWLDIDLPYSRSYGSRSRTHNCHWQYKDL